MVKNGSDQHFYKVPLKGLELKTRPFDTADFAENPRKINDLGVNVIEQNRVVCPTCGQTVGAPSEALPYLHGCKLPYLYELREPSVIKNVEIVRRTLADAAPQDQARRAVRLWVEMLT